MPEGHDLHRFARDHSKYLAGQQVIVSSPQGRFEKEAKRLNGKVLAIAQAHGKHLFYRWGTAASSKRQTTMHVHLGLYGKFRVHRNPPPPPRGAVRVRMIGDRNTIDLNGPTKCEIYTKADEQKLMARLGPDPLDQNADSEAVFAKFQRSKKAIGGLLLDQSVLAGVGNMYRAEILFILGIDPETPGHKITGEQFDRLWQLTVDLLKIGMKHGRIITIGMDQINKSIKSLTRSERVQIYKKQNCRRCGSKVRKWQLAARTMYACPVCQK